MTVFHEVREDGKLWGIAFSCPGCQETHSVPVVPPKGWTWNGDREKSSLSPSILCHETLGPNKERLLPRCHSIISNGSIQFMADSQHTLAGKTVPLPEWKGYG
jgi:hypothetical protein